MQYRIDPKSGNKLSILGFGCMRFPRNLGKTDFKKTENLILDAIDKGINYFDTAYLYPGSEETLGQILENNNLRKNVFIATKLPFTHCKSYEDFDRYFNTQLNRLKTTYIDYYFIHAIGSSLQWSVLCDLGIERWISEKKKEGKIKSVGFSFHGIRDEFPKLLDLYDWDFCQIQYNYININYQAGEFGLKEASKRGLPVFIMEPLLGGTLANKLPLKAQEVFKNTNNKYSPAAWSLRWLWNQPEVTVLLSGMNEFDQLNENVSIAKESTSNMLLDSEHNAISKVIDIFNESYKIPCTGCNYCMPCPKNINIPSCFSAYNSSYSISKITGITQYVLSTGATSKEPATFASTCIKCGKCEQHCPQNIEIRKSLELVSKRMEPFWFKGAISLVKKIKLR